jgi:Ser/Thr protein kinase RdoA (MazF antagonist)
MSSTENPNPASVMEAKAPAFATADAERIAKEGFGVVGEAECLRSERDQNFHLRTQEGREWLLKISNPAEDPSVVDFQTRALLHIARVDPDLAVPHLVTTPDGSPTHDVDGPDGRRFITRLLSFLPGTLLDDARLTPRLLRDVGATTAKLARALRGFSHPAGRHELLWDLTQVPRLRGRTRHIDDPARRRRVEQVLDQFIEQVLPVLRGLRAQVIHNDVSCMNTLVDGDSVTGVIDFGDLIHAPLVCDIAVPVSELIIDADDPIEAAMEVVAGYHGVTPFTADELRVVFDVVTMRLAMLVVISAWRAGDHPENIEYITAGVEDNSKMLDRLIEQGPDSFHARLRQACGLPASVPSVGRDSKSSAGSDP